VIGLLADVYLVMTMKDSLLIHVRMTSDRMISSATMNLQVTEANLSYLGFNRAVVGVSFLAAVGMTVRLDNVALQSNLFVP
jgi:hypothetical protein